MVSSLSVTLSGRRVTLTPLSLEDVPGLVDAACEDRTTYEWATIASNIDDMDVAVRKLLEGRDDGTMVPFATRRSDTSEIIGMTRYLNLRSYFGRDFPDAVEIGGTFLSSSAQRTGANTEAKFLMMRHAFEVWGVRRLDIKTDERNERARRAIERVGAQFEGVLRNWQAAQVAGEDGRTRNSAMYSVLDAEWPEVRAMLEQRLA